MYAAVPTDNPAPPRTSPASPIRQGHRWLERLRPSLRFAPGVAIVKVSRPRGAIPSRISGELQYDEATALRYIALTILVVRPLIGDEFWNEYPQETELPSPWYRGRCHEVCTNIQTVAEQLAAAGELDLRAKLIHGAFQALDDPAPLQHAWFELPDGTIVDPTSNQMGFTEAAAVIRPGDPRHGYYDSTRTWTFGELPEPVNESS